MSTTSDDPRIEAILGYFADLAIPGATAREMAVKCLADADAAVEAGPCLHGDELDVFIMQQARRDPAFAASFLNHQGISLLRLWLDAWDNGGKYPIDGTRLALAGAAASGETT